MEPLTHTSREPLSARLVSWHALPAAPLISQPRYRLQPRASALAQAACQAAQKRRRRRRFPGTAGRRGGGGRRLCYRALLRARGGGGPTRLLLCRGDGEVDRIGAVARCVLVLLRRLGRSQPPRAAAARMRLQPHGAPHDDRRVPQRRLLRRLDSRDLCLSLAPLVAALLRAKSVTLSPHARRRIICNQGRVCPGQGGLTARCAVPTIAAKLLSRRPPPA